MCATVATLALVLVFCVDLVSCGEQAGAAQMDPQALMQSLGGVAQYMREHPLPPHLANQAPFAGRPAAPSQPVAPAAPAAPEMQASGYDGSSEGSRLLPNMQPMSHSMMMPLLSLPAIMENPSRLLSGVALAPLWDSSAQGMTARNAVFGGMNPRSRDEVVHQNLLSFVMARKLVESLGKDATGVDFKNSFVNWFDHRHSGDKNVGVYSD